MALWTLSGTTWVSWYQKKHSHTHTHHGHQTSLSASLSFTNHDILLVQFTCHNLSPSFLWSTTSYTIHFFTQSLSSFCSTRPYLCNLFCCSTEIMSSNPSLSLNPLLGTLSSSATHPSDHSHLCPLKCHLSFHNYLKLCWMTHGQ